MAALVIVCILVLIVLVGLCFPRKQSGFSVLQVNDVHPYYEMQNSPKLIGFHYSPRSPPSNQLWPIWNRLKQDIGEITQQQVSFVENNEETNPTAFVYSLPMIIKYEFGRTDVYGGPLDYYPLYKWILQPINNKWPGFLFG